MLLFMDEISTGTLIAMGVKIFSIWLIIDAVKLLRELKHSLLSVLCRESPHNLVNVLGPFSVALQP